MTKVTKVEAVVALQWVTVELCGRVQVSMKDNMLHDAIIGGARIGEVYVE